MIDGVEMEASYSDEQARQAVEQFASDLRSVRNMLEDTCGSMPGEPSFPNWVSYDNGSRVSVLARAARLAEAGYVFSDNETSSLSGMIDATLHAARLEQRLYPGIFTDSIPGILELTDRIDRT